MNIKGFSIILLTIGLAFISILLLFVLVPSSVAALQSPQMKATDWQLYEPIAEVVDPTGDIFATRAVEEKDGYVYLLTRLGILYTYNISDLPQQQSFTTYNTPVYTQTLSTGYGLLRYGNYIYAFGYAGFEILDVQNPSTPSFIGSRNDLPIYNMIRHDNYLIAVGNQKVAVYLVDDPSNPTFLSDLNLGQGQWGWSAAVYSNTLYTHHWKTDWHDTFTYTLSIIDFSNPSSLTTINTINIDDSPYHLKVVDNQLVECTTTYVGLWNLTTPTTPTLQTIQPAEARVCAQDGKNIITNGIVFHPNGNELQTVTTFTPGGSQADGWPYGSAVNSSYVFIAQGSRILILNAINPVLSTNYASGGPGSYFTITGQDFPPNSTATIIVNGNILGTLPTDSSGNLIFLLNSDQADEGQYVVTVTVNPSASTRILIASGEPVRPQEGSGTIFNIPPGIAYTNIVYLPFSLK